MTLQPGNLAVINDWANTAWAAGFVREAANAMRSVLLRVQRPLGYRVASNYLLVLQYLPGLADDALLAAAREIGQQLPASAPLTPRAPEGRLRLGFVSADLCDHPVGLFLLPLLRHLDRARFDVALYANGSRADNTTARLQALGHWHSLVGLDHDAATELIRSHGIDVLIDLSGHTAGNRLPVFARRAAPVQVSWLGYFATTGVPAMDFVLMDRCHVPQGADQGFSEQVLRMPDCRFCYEPADFAPAVAAPPCLQRGFVSFGSFNNTAKLNDEVLDVWAAILGKVPHSRLILKWRNFADPVLCDRITRRFVQSGIEASRIELRGQSFHVDVLREYADVDIALDPFPFSGGQTSCEALWMGLPLVTLPGTRPVSRQSLSFIASLGQAAWLRDWVADSAQDYVEKAVALAGNSSGLASIRASMRDVMSASPLMDAKAFARDFQSTIEGALAHAGPSKGSAT